MNSCPGSGLAVGFVRVCLAMVGVVIVLQSANQKVWDSNGVSTYPRLLAAARYDENDDLPLRRRLSQKYDEKKKGWVKDSTDGENVVKLSPGMTWSVIGNTMVITVPTDTGNKAENNPSMTWSPPSQSKGKQGNDISPSGTATTDVKQGPNANTGQVVGSGIPQSKGKQGNDISPSGTATTDVKQGPNANTGQVVGSGIPQSKGKQGNDISPSGTATTTNPTDVKQGPNANTVGGNMKVSSDNRNDPTGLNSRNNASTVQDWGRTNDANASKPESSTTNDSNVVIDDRQFENMYNSSNNLTGNAKDSPLKLPLEGTILLIGISFLSVIVACLCMISSFLHTRTDKMDDFDVPDSPSDMEDAVE